MAPTVHLVLVPGSRALRDLAAGGAFVGGCESLSLTDLCELVVEGEGHKLTIGAKVVYLDGNGNAGIELDPSRRAELIAFVEAFEAGPASMPSEAIEPERADSTQADSEQAQLHRAVSKQNDSERASSDRASSDRTDSERADSEQADSDRADSDRADFEPSKLDRAELHRAEDRSDSDRSDSDRSELYRAESERLESRLSESELFDFSFSEAELAGSEAESSATSSDDDELVLTFADEEPIARGSDAAIENVRDPDDPEPTERIDPLDPGELEDGDDEPARTLHERLRGLTLAEQLKRAHHGDVTERTMLERMYGKNVWEALLRNPRLTAPEVARIARMGSLPKPQLEVIVSNGGWLQIPEVRRALLSNPRLSPDQILRVLRLMPKHELKLAGSQTVYPHAVRDAAKRLAKTESR